MGRHLRRLSRPLPAAMAFCAAGLLAAIVIVGVNRSVAARPVLPPALLFGSPAAHTPAPAATPTPPSGTLGCAAGSAVPASLDGLHLSSDAGVLLASGGDTVSITMPAGAHLSGSASALTVQIAGVHGKTQQLKGAVAQDITLCATGSSGAALVTIPAGSSADAQVKAGPMGIEVDTVSFTTAPPSGSSGGNSGGDGGDG